MYFSTSATFSGPPSSSISSSRVLGGRCSASSSSCSSRSLFIFWACSTESWLVMQLSWLSDLTFKQENITINHTLKDCQLGHAACGLPMAGVVGGLTGALKAGLVEPSPEASKALWMESGSMLFLLFFFFSFFPFFGSFLISHGSIARERIMVCSMHFGFKMFYFLKLAQNLLSPSSSSSSDSSLNGLKSSSSSAELTDLKLSSLSQSLPESLSDSSDSLSSELVPDKPPCLRGFFLCCFLTSWPNDDIKKQKQIKNIDS